MLDIMEGVDDGTDMLSCPEDRSLALPASLVGEYINAIPPKVVISCLLLTREWNFKIDTCGRSFHMDLVFRIQVKNGHIAFSAVLLTPCMTRSTLGDTAHLLFLESHIWCMSFLRADGRQTLSSLVYESLIFQHGRNLNACLKGK